MVRFVLFHVEHVLGESGWHFARIVMAFVTKCCLRHWWNPQGAKTSRPALSLLSLLSLLWAPMCGACVVSSRGAQEEDLASSQSEGIWLAKLNALELKFFRSVLAFLIAVAELRSLQYGSLLAKP